MKTFIIVEYNHQGYDQNDTVLNRFVSNDVKAILEYCHINLPKPNNEKSFECEIWEGGKMLIEINLNHTEYETTITNYLNKKIS